MPALGRHPLLHEYGFGSSSWNHEAAIPLLRGCRFKTGMTIEV